MRAVRYHGPRRPLRLEEVPEPEPGPGEVRVRVRAAGMCHTELHFVSGLLDLGVAPLTLGHEIVGVVEAAGPGVDAPRAGERVIVYYYAGCGRCEWCRRGDEHLCDRLRAEYGFLSDGGYAEHVVVPARNAVPLPDAVDDVAAAPIGCGVTTAIHAGRLAGLRAGETILVYGVGAVGFGLIQFGRLAGATVIGVGRSAAKLARARELGPTPPSTPGARMWPSACAPSPAGAGRTRSSSWSPRARRWAMRSRASPSGAGSSSSATRRTPSPSTRSSW